MHNLHSYQILTSHISAIPKQAALSRSCCLTTCTAGNLCWYSTQGRNTPLLSNRQTYASELVFFFLSSPCSFEFLPTTGAPSSSSNSQYCLVTVFLLWHQFCFVTLTHRFAASLFSHPKVLLPLVSGYNFKELQIKVLYSGGCGY